MGRAVLVRGIRARSGTSGSATSLGANRSCISCGRFILLLHLPDALISHTFELFHRCVSVRCKFRFDPVTIPTINRPPLGSNFQPAYRVVDKALSHCFLVAPVEGRVARNSTG